MDMHHVSFSKWITERAGPIKVILCPTMYKWIYLVFIRLLCIFVDILTVYYTFIHFLYYQICV